MKSLSDHAKKELYNALEGRESGVFFINGKLFSIEVENEDMELRSNLNEDLTKEINEYPELKESLTRYLDNSDMKRYSGSELKSKRNGQRK
jgi:hypothetical protein